MVFSWEARLCLRSFLDAFIAASADGSWQGIEALIKLYCRFNAALGGCITLSPTIHDYLPVFGVPRKARRDSIIFERHDEDHGVYFCRFA